jgi:hypothetical protein
LHAKRELTAAEGGDPHPHPNPSREGVKSSSLVPGLEYLCVACDMLRPRGRC